MGMGASTEGPDAINEISRIVEKILVNYRVYFDKGEVLNSDGRRLLVTALRYARRAPPPVRRRLRETLRDPSLQAIRKLAEALGLDPSVAENGWPYTL
ncbi:MAG: hypothetical protein OSP8Acid_04030 [uncultured Acidilobus sp. OSP8]|jgi:hypothetical protein|nr:MAG: hypothetical protein OSP8Acid_04030 [uncultured Acidilobus sp. OSP8]